MNRNDVTEKIITVKVSKGITWESVAKKLATAKNGSPPVAWVR